MLRRRRRGTTRSGRLRLASRGRPPAGRSRGSGTRCASARTRTVPVTWRSARHWRSLPARRLSSADTVATKRVRYHGGLFWLSLILPQNLIYALEEAELSYLPDHPTHHIGLPRHQFHQRRSLKGQYRHHGVKGDLSQPPDTVPLQPSRLLYRLEHPLDGLPFGVEGLPLRPVPPDGPEQPDVRNYLKI